MSYLSEFSLSRRFVRQSSDNLQAVQSTHIQEILARIIIHFSSLFKVTGPTFLAYHLQ